MLAEILHGNIGILKKTKKKMHFKDLKIIKKLTVVNSLGKSRQASSGFSSLVPIHHASEKTICSRRKESLNHMYMLQGHIS